jgi:putative transposase
MGLDYSSGSLYVDHMGNQPDYPRYYREAEAILKKEQRKLSKIGNCETLKKKSAIYTKF